MVNFVFMSHRFFIFFSILVIRDVAPESGICFCCHIYPFLVFFNTYITKNTFLGNIYTLLFCLLCPPKNILVVFYLSLSAILSVLPFILIGTGFFVLEFLTKASLIVTRFVSLVVGFLVLTLPVIEILFILSVFTTIRE